MAATMIPTAETYWASQRVAVAAACCVVPA
jgi:hypothetical protein